MSINNELANAATGERDYSLDFPFSLGAPCHEAGFRTEIDDFQVVEDLGFLPDGGGEHLLLNIRKRDQNTRWVAGLLAQWYEVEDSAVGYCGLKDRRAVTTQWFSIHLPGKGEISMPALEGCDILAHGRHPRKLRPGMHRSNAFRLVLRFSQGRIEDVNNRLELIQVQGVPNYFGEQRFGRDGNNLVEVERIVSSQRPRFRGRRGGLYLSAARSWLFNQVLAERVARGSWKDDAVRDGPLWGRGRVRIDEAAVREEATILEPWQPWCLALEHSGLQQERRPLVLHPMDLHWAWQDCNLELSFSLPPGTYATAVVREIARLRLPARGYPDDIADTLA